MYPDLSKIEQSGDRPSSGRNNFAVPSDPGDAPNAAYLNEASRASMR